MFPESPCHLCFVEITGEDNLCVSDVFLLKLAILSQNVIKSSEGGGIGKGT